MAMAKPVIASAVSDLPLMLQNGVRIVPPNDARALAEAIADICMHPEVAEQMGRNTRAKCLQEYNAAVTRA